MTLLANQQGSWTNQQDSWTVHPRHRSGVHPAGVHPGHLGRLVAWTAVCTPPAVAVAVRFDSEGVLFASELHEDNWDYQEGAALSSIRCAIRCDRSDIDNLLAGRQE